MTYASGGETPKKGEWKMEILGLCIDSEMRACGIQENESLGGIRHG